ncbi:MAG: hypothetical protein NC489_25800 [Ruminococcus flavefaciens]|nr:hypothetical protein [Ruminococcus flavefaciens]
MQKGYQMWYQTSPLGDGVYCIHPVIGDFLRRYNSNREVREARNHITEVKIDYDGDLNELARSGNYLWRASTITPDRTRTVTPWCVGKLAAEEKAQEMGFDMAATNFECAELCEQCTFPVTCPFEVTLYRNEKGLYCSIDLHPEETGGFRDKFLFPDRSCKNQLCVGPVVVTKVDDRGNYGFITASMKQYSRPNEGLVAEYLVNDPATWGGMLQMIKTPFGPLTRLSVEKRNKHSGRVESVNNTILLEEYPGANKVRAAHWLENFVSGDEVSAKVTIEEEISVADFLCQGYQGCTISELSAKIKRVPFENLRSYRSIKFISDLFDAAVKHGVFKIYTFDNVNYVEVYDECLLEFALAFTKEEVDKIIGTVNKLNESATATFKSRIAKGKLRIN